MSVRVLVADDHPMVREGLEAMLSSEGGFEVAGLASNGAEAAEAAERLAPDVVLSDVRMPVADGFAMLADMKRRGVKARVVFLAGMPLKDEERRAREEGAAGYLPKDVDQDRLAEAVRNAAADPASFACDDFKPAPSMLTRRETEVLRLAALGRQRDEIAAELGIGAESVKTHMKGVMNKLSRPNSAAAVARAYELGILRA